MRVKSWLLVFALLIGGAVLGAAALLGSIVVNHYTSTDAFCSSSCHSMTFVAADPHFQHSPHRSNSEGVRPSCGDCHIPTTNWFIETYTHASSGLRDVIAEFTHNFGDARTWEARRIELADEVRDLMRKQDSVTCRSCHDAAAIRPRSEAGRAAHALLDQRRLTCIDCHFNLVHAPVPPSIDFIRSSGIGTASK